MNIPDWLGVEKIYRKHSRNRGYNVNDDSKAQLSKLWTACGNEPTYYWSLEALADEFEVNCLQPLPPQEPKPPQMWSDMWGNALPNPHVTKDLKGQSVIAKRDPELSRLLKAFADDPYGTVARWQDEIERVKRLRAFGYNSDTQAANPYCQQPRDMTAINQFIRNVGEDIARRCEWESKPVQLPIGNGFNMTVMNRIYLGNRRLFNILDSIRTSAEREAQQRKEALKKQRKELEEKLRALGEAV